jgi:hypothetical protein
MIEELQQQLRVLKGRTAWNPRGLFLVLLSQQEDVETAMARQVLELLWTNKALNALVVVPTTASALDLYTWRPYESPDICMQVKEVVLDSWLFEDDGHFSSNSHLFPQKFPYDLKGCSITVSTLELMPFVLISKKDDSEETCADGLECRIFTLIVEKLNATFQLKFPGEERWGKKLGNNLWSGMKGHLFKNISDMAFGALLLDTEECDVFECTAPYFESRLLWYVPRAKQIAKWTSVFRVFRPTTWLAFIAVCVSVVLLLWRMSSSDTRRSERLSYRRFSECFCNVWAAVLGVSVPQMPHTSNVRTLFLFWLFYCLHINVVYLSFVTTFMINPGSEHQIQNVEELVKSDVEFGYHEGYDVHFSDATDASSQNILRHRTQCGSSDKKCLERLVTKGDFAMLAATDIVEYTAACRYLQKPGKSLFYPFQGGFVSSNYVMYLTKGSPLLDRINSIIRHATEAGLVNQWWTEIINSCTLKCYMEVQEESSTLTMSHLQSAYFILFLGLGFSFSVFVVEVICVFGRKKCLKKVA